jgi:putative copper export protein/mono/diheme cytochrome c family protein
LLANAVIAARGTNLAATLSSFGIAVFTLVVVPGTSPAMSRRLRKMLWISAAVAWAGGAAWLAAEAGDMAGADNFGEARRARPAVLVGTRFGNTLGLRLVLLLAAAIAFGGRRWRSGAAAAFAGSAAAAQAWLGHAAAVEEITLPASVILHVLGAGAWLGGLGPLFWLVSAEPAGAAVRAARRFSVLGYLAVAVLAGTAFVQGRLLIGGLPGLVGTTYGHLALAKLTLFALLVGLAALNRWLLVPRLAADQPDARRKLRISIGVETAIGLAIVLTAAVLAQQFPASHEQPDWPFPWRLDASLLSDPATRHALVPAALGIGLAGALGVAGAAIRRLRWPALGVGAALILLAVPWFDALLVPAYPTTFYTSLTDFSVESIVHGATLFGRHCAACHGADGRGNGPAAPRLPIQPADLTALHLWAHPDGDLYWWITNGYADPSAGGLVMPGFAQAIPDDQRWNVIDYLHAHAAGAEVAAQGSWPVAVPAPEMDVSCAGGDFSLSDLRGGVVRVIAGGGPGSDLAGAALTNVVLAATPLAPGKGFCVGRDPDAPAAFAIIAGLTAQELPGTELLIDPQGWIRRLWRTDEASGAPAAADLDAAVRDVTEHPVQQSMPAHHH